MTMSTCNVTFWKDKDFKGNNKNYDGAQNVPDLNDVQWSGESHDDMKDDIGSIQTSTATWVRVYSKASYSGRTALIGPNSNVNMEDLRDDNNQDDMDDTIESFQLYDHKPSVNTSNIQQNLRKLYPGSTYSSLHNLWNSEFHAQDSEYRIYDPTIVLNSTSIDFLMNLDHVQAENDDHAVVTFSMDFYGNFTKSISVTYQMADASQIPGWAIKLIDGAIDVAADAAKIIADGAEIVITDGVGVVATVETNKLIDYTAKALTFCIDHLNTVLSAIFKYQDDGGATYFPAAVSQSIARLVYAYYQELYGNDSNTAMRFSESGFLGALGASNWATDKGNPYVNFGYASHTYRSYFPDNSFFYAHGGALSSVKIDAVTNNQKDDHLIMQASFSPTGELFSVVGCIDIFLIKNIDDYTAPATGVITRNSSGQMINIRQDGTVAVINYGSLEAAYSDLMTRALKDTASKYDISLSDQQSNLVGASLQVLSAMNAAI
jgi:hypothetical protein